MERLPSVDGSDDVSALNAALVEKLKGSGCITSPRVEAAFRAVRRHLFLPDLPLDQVYQDEAIPTKRRDGIPISSSSQPAIMAIMLEQLDLQLGQRVLEIGAGTGYNAALMAQIVGETGYVVTVDIDQDIVDAARVHLAAAGLERVQVVCADGARGYPDAAPYGRIILTVAAWDIAPAWVDQLQPDGRLVLPLVIKRAQKAVAFEPSGDHLASVSVQPCGFMLLRGAFAGPERSISLGLKTGLSITVEERDDVDAEAVHRLLTRPSEDRPANVHATLADVFSGLSTWLALREPAFCSLSAEAGAEGHSLVPELFTSSTGWRATAGLLDDTGMAMLGCSAEPGAAAGGSEQPRTFNLFVREYGKGTSAAKRLLDQVRAWDAAGQPSLDNVRIRAYPREARYVASGGEIVIPKRWYDLVLDAG